MILAGMLLVVYLLLEFLSYIIIGNFSCNFIHACERERVSISIDFATKPRRSVFGFLMHDPIGRIVVPCKQRSGFAVSKFSYFDLLAFGGAGVLSFLMLKGIIVPITGDGLFDHRWVYISLMIFINTWIWQFISYFRPRKWYYLDVYDAAEIEFL